NSPTNNVSFRQKGARRHLPDGKTGRTGVHPNQYWAGCRGDTLHLNLEPQYSLVKELCNRPLVAPPHGAALTVHVTITRRTRVSQSFMTADSFEFGHSQTFDCLLHFITG